MSDAEYFLFNASMKATRRRLVARFQFLVLLVSNLFVDFVVNADALTHGTRGFDGDCKSGRVTADTSILRGSRAIEVGLVG